MSERLVVYNVCTRDYNGAPTLVLETWRTEEQAMKSARSRSEEDLEGTYYVLPCVVLDSE